MLKHFATGILCNIVHISVGAYNWNTALVFLFLLFFSCAQVAGNPSVNLLPLDPLEVPHILIEQGEESPVNVVLKFSNNKVIGISKAEFYKIT